MSPTGGDEHGARSGLPTTSPAAVLSSAILTVACTATGDSRDAVPQVGAHRKLRYTTRLFLVACRDTDRKPVGARLNEASDTNLAA